MKFSPEFRDAFSGFAGADNVTVMHGRGHIITHVKSTEPYYEAKPDMQILPDSRLAGTVGLLVFGDNHLVLHGPRPDRGQAIELANHWSFVRIGASMPKSLLRWTIVTKWLRERLDWAVIAPGHGARNLAVAQLLGEIAERGIPIDDYSR